MTTPYDKERFEELLEERNGGVTPVMWAALVFFGTLAIAIVMLINPNDGPAPTQTHALRGSAIETTGAASSEPDPQQEIDRRWPQE